MNTMPDPIPPREPAVLFPGAAGEMAARVRATDWSRTPLGPIGAWPHSLRALVGVVLEHPMPSILLWGTELTQVYNDAYAVLAAAKHPAALGMPTRQCWPEVWHINQPIYEAVLSRGESVLREDALYPLERHGAGRAEDVYLTISYSPARDDAGHIAGVFITITETTRKVIAEERLRQSEALLAEAQEVAHVGSWNWDLRTDAITWSAEHYRIFGLPPQGGPIAAERALSYIHPDDRAATREALDRSRRTREPYVLRLRLVREDGAQRIVESRGQTAFDAGGEPVRMFGTLQDVTERVRAEQALRVANERLDLAMRGSKIGIWEVDMPDGDQPNGRVWSVNFWESLGYGPHEFPTDVAGSMALMHPEDRERTTRTIAAYMAGDSSDFEVENRSLHKDGSYRWFLTRGVAARGSDGMVIRLTGTVQDVTERKRAEEALRASEECLAADLANTTRLQELSTRFVQAGDLHLLLKEIITAAAELLGTNKGNIQLVDPSGALRIVVHHGHGPRFVGHFASHGCEATCEAARRLARRVIIEDITRVVALEGTTDLEVLLDDGIRAIQSTPLVTRDGRLLGMLNNHFPVPHRPSDRDLRLLDVLARMAADFIERSQAEDALRQAKEEAERANRAKDDFLAMVSHELRTPLAGILLWSQMLENQTLKPEDEGHALRAIRESAKAQQQLIDDLLDVSRMLTGKMRLHVRETELGPVVSAAINTVKPAARAKGVLLEEELDAGAGRAQADATRLQQVVLNLLGNAVKFTPAGGTVSVRLRRAGPVIELRVADTGQGIGAGFLPHVFERFRQADPSTTRRHGGLGLGLAIARELVVLHGGTIRAESPGEGHGATFTVELPATDAGLDSPPPVRASGSAEAEWRFTPSPVLKGVRALVVEDDAATREVIEYLLERCEADVTAVADASEALREFGANDEGHGFDVVLSDLGLPEMSGHELMRRIRSLERQAGRVPPTPAVAFTASARDADRAAAIDAGFSAHLAKPVTAGGLINTVARCLGRTGQPTGTGA